MKSFLAAVTVACAFAITARAEEPAIGHMVFFELKDKSAESKQKLVDACYKLLKNHEGVLYFSAGPRADESIGAFMRAVRPLLAAATRPAASP